MDLNDLVIQSERAITAAGPRFTPGHDPNAPNIRVAHLVDAVDALSFQDGFRARIREHEARLREAADRTRFTLDDVFKARSVTPTVVADDLMRLCTLEAPGEIRSQVLRIRRRCALLEKRLQEEQQTIDNVRSSLAEDDKQGRDRLEGRLQDLFPVSRAVSELLSYLTGVPGTLLADNTALLVLGAWGTGKTHFVCDLARTALGAGVPALLVLANSLDPNLNPLDALAATTGLANSGDDLLEQLNELGAASNRRALILVDAINEGDRERWRKSVASVVRKTRRHDNVALVLTCRTPFDNTIFDDRSRSMFVRADHYGFEDQEFDAQLEFFSHYSIPAPHVPLLTQEFSRPLFLKILCEAISRLSRRSRGRKLREISSGQKSMNHVLEYFVDKVGADIESDFGLRRGSCWLILKGKPRAGHRGLAGLMAEETRDWVFPADAVTEVRAQTALTDSQARSLLARFVTDGLLSETATYENGASTEVLTFSYQRFGDHIIARHLLEKHLNTSTEAVVRRSFYANQPLGKIFTVDQWGREFQEPGLATAIMLEFPERMKRSGLGRELVWYLPKKQRLVMPVKEAFLEGLYWRSTDSFTRETTRVVRFLLDFDTDNVRFETLEVLVALAARPEHPYSARALHRYLSNMTLVDRDLTWSEYIRSWDDLSALRRLLTWVEKRSDSRIPKTVARNDITLLSLGLTTTDRPLRDRLTRAICDIGLKHPKLLFDLTLASLTFDDPYVSERMLAASYGVCMRLWADPKGQTLRTAIVPFARQLVREMFLPGAPHGTFHTLRQDYALGVIDLCRRIAPNAIATQHVHYLRRPKSQLISPFRAADQITEADVAGSKDALHMDFENYTIGGLIPHRANYDMNEPTYAGVRKQILYRIKELGYESSRFDEIDKRIGRYNWNARESGKTDRYGKKYSWIAFFEMYGLLDDRGQLPDWRQGERTADCDVDPSFPDPPREWKPRLPNLFDNAPTAPSRWLVEGPVPNYRGLLQRDGIDRQRGPWVLLDGYVAQGGTHDREVFTFIRAALVDEHRIEDLERLIARKAYLGNSTVPDAPTDYYTYLSEVPWSHRYGSDIRNTQGKAIRQLGEALHRYENGRWTGVPVEIPIRHWGWEGHHTELTQFGGVTFPAPALCEALGLVNHDRSLDLRDANGDIASLYRDWPNEHRDFSRSHLLYLRADLIRRYLGQTGQKLVWVSRGERTLHYEMLSNTNDPAVQAARANHLDSYADPSLVRLESQRLDFSRFSLQFLGSALQDRVQIVSGQVHQTPCQHRLKVDPLAPVEN